jgi:hypothetical protein
VGTAGCESVLPEMKSSKLFIRSLLALVVISVSASAQNVQRQLERGEELTYEAEFSRALLKGIDVADFHFSAGRLNADPNTGTGERPDATLQLTGEIKSKGFFARLFNLNFLERITSLVEPESFTLKNTKRYDEQGKRIRSSETIYDHAAGKIVWTEHDLRDPSREPRTQSSEFTGKVQDILSAIYFLRTQPLELNKMFMLNVTDSGRVYQVPIQVMEKKRMKTVLGRQDTLRVDVGLFGNQRIIQSNGQFSIWLTADARRIPVKAQIKNDIGTFDIKLKRVNQPQLTASLK